MARCRARGGRGSHARSLPLAFDQGRGARPLSAGQPIQLRRYQRLALDAFEADRAAGRPHTHIVAPPGSGKTVMGIEIARRLGAPALVLCPTAAIRSQWDAQDAGVPLTALTYQAICQTDDPDSALREAAEARWSAEQAAAGTGAGTESRRRETEIRRITAQIKREIARDGRSRDLLSAGAMERIAALREARVRTVILDECHHLVSMWGYLVRDAIGELGDGVHVVGLTATSPADMTEEEAELYLELLGDVDFETPTPAVVRDGHLAPYQELALISTPLESELAWLRERHVRFQEMLDRLVEVGDDELSFPLWVSNRMRHRGAGDAEISFGELLRRQPDLARAGVRYLSSAGLELPPGAPRGEGFREPPTIEDWTCLISDYALRCLRAHPGEEADRRLDDLATALADLGFTLTRTGIRPGRTDIDRVLVHSSVKPMLAADVLAAELVARGGRLRAAVLCDSERPPRQPEGSPLVLGGGGRGLLAAIAADPRLAAVRPLLVTGETFACAPSDAEALVAELRERGLDGVGTSEDGDVAVVSGLREWVTVASALLHDGWSGCVIGTRALLGEGWNAPTVNCLVDATSVAASISTRQMRGRTLRLDPEDPEKIASNWDLVCVAPDLERGAADYRRFVRRHRHLHAPCEDGSIESGVSHVHPELSPFAPPPEADFAELNAEALARAADPARARERWRIGEPYRAVELPALLVRRRGAAAEAARAEVGLGGMAPAPPPRWWMLPRARRRHFPAVLPLERAALAVADAYLSLGEISPAARASVAWQQRAGGYVRCLLADGSPEENALFAAALEDAISPATGHRYVLSRPVAGGRWPRYANAWHPVPADLGRNRARADAYRGAFTRWLGPGSLLYVSSTEEGRAAHAEAAAAAPPWEAQTRRLWV